jgi:class 3 adenylate cyclase/predicted ATPase/ABC-type transport system involved in cytochrome c biogenesis ATPase subunit
MEPGVPAHIELPPMSDWLVAVGLARLEPLLRDNGIAEDVLTSLTETDLEKIGISLGDRKRLMKAIGELAARVVSAPVAATDKVMAAATAERDAAHSELRQLTIMFCDLVDATALCARLSPEQWRQVVLAYQRAAVAVIGRCGGTVAQYLGDGLLVYFGYPQAQEDAAVRAVHAALELVARIPALDITVDGHADVRLQLRIGIDTGRVVIGDIGAGSRKEQLALGDTPNIAARLQGLAATNEVLITEQTQRLTAGSFRYEDRGVHALKGVAGPRQVWRVLGVADTVSRFDALTGAQISPLVGREQELDALLACWQRAAQGQGQMLVLSGEAGIGKSRLLRELTDRVTPSGAQVLSLQCVAHRAEIAFHPFIDALERVLHFKADTPVSVKLDRLDALVGARLGGNVAQAALLAAMLSIPTDGRHELPVSSAQQREQDIIKALCDLFDVMAAQAPVLILLEDAHWSDPASLAVLQAFAERVPRMAAMLAVTHRPEFVAPWAGQDTVTVLRLQGLPVDAVSQLVARLMGDQVLPPALARQIEQRTDGVPLFVEELTRTLLEQSAQGEVQPGHGQTLPATLRDSLMARLERHAAAKEVAQIGAVIGRTFSHALLAALFEQGPARLADGIDALLRSGLATREDDEQGVRYVFKHALVQDTAYDSLVRERREHLHAAVVAHIESVDPDVTQRQPAMLARHAAAAGQMRVALAYWRRASEQAIQRLALREALSHLQAGLDAAQRLPTGADRDQQELQLHASLGTVHMLSKGWAAPEVEHAYRRANELASAADKVDEAIWPLWGVCVYHQVRGEIRQAQAIGRRMSTVARQANSRQAWLVYNMMQTQLCFYGGQLAAVPGFVEQVEHGYSDPQHRALIALYSTDLQLVSMVHGLHAQWIMGQVEDLDAAYAAVEQRALVLQHPYSLAWARTWGVMTYLHAGRLDRLLPRLQAGWHLADEHGFAYVSAMARFAMGWCRTQLASEAGALEDGLALMQQGLSAFEATGAGIVLPFFRALMAEAWGKAGRFDEALACIEAARTQTDRGGERWHEPELYRIQGDLLLARAPTDTASAVTCYRQAVALAEAQQAWTWRQRAQAALQALGMGDLPGAHADQAA